MSTPAPLILLVEDDVLLRDAIQLLLEDAGYRVIEAGSAAEALSRVASETPSLVLLDLGLPDLSGLEVARRMREHPTMANVPIVALTGRAGAAEVEACTDAGCTHFLTKPVEPRKLLEQLPALLG